MTTIKMNGVGFNPEHVLSFESADAFADYELYQKLWHRESETERKKRLRMVWELAKLQKPQSVESIALNNIQLTDNAENDTTPTGQSAKLGRASRDTKSAAANKGASDTVTEGAAI